MAIANPPLRPSFYDKKVGLVLQGGGALGSYQAGVYEALASSEYLPDWVAGISIGAVNAAIIAGNTPGNPLKRLRSFWEEITAHTSLWPSALGGSLAVWQQQASALIALMFGRPGFFTPRALQDWFSPGKLISYYDTSALKGTLERLVDFDRINNAREMRLSVGAVNVRAGQFAGDQLAVPGQDGVRLRDSCDLSKHLAAQAMANFGERDALGVRQIHPPVQLGLQDAVLGG
jgi:NTE family protein